jgi:hypothetical protein
VDGGGLTAARIRLVFGSTTSPLAGMMVTIGHHIPIVCRHPAGREHVDDSGIFFWGYIASPIETNKTTGVKQDKWFEPQNQHPFA